MATMISPHTAFFITGPDRKHANHAIVGDPSGTVEWLLLARLPKIALDERLTTTPTAAPTSGPDPEETFSRPVSAQPRTTIWLVRKIDLLPSRRGNDSPSGAPVGNADGA